MKPVKIIIRPTDESGGRYEVRREGHKAVLCVSRMPLFDAARKLMPLMIGDENVMIEVYREGESAWAYRAPLAWAARHAVTERSARGLAVEPWKPSHGVEALE